MEYDIAIKNNIHHISIWRYYQDILFSANTMMLNKMCAWPLAWDESKGNTLGIHSATAVQGLVEALLTSGPHHPLNFVPCVCVA